jgi:amino acid efflux transporter
VSATTRAGIGVAEAVLGAGMILIPPLVATLAGPLTLWAWATHLLGGAVFSALLGLLAFTRTGGGSIAGVTRTGVGDRRPRTNDAG